MTPTIRETPQTSTIYGLSSQEALARQAAGQGNDAPLTTSRSYAQILRENVFTFINYVLFGLGLALIIMARVSDALVSVGVVLANTLVGVVQEIRAKRTLDRIAILTRPRATVIRDGREQTVDPGEVVLGDVLLARPGDQIVVDGVVVGDGRMDVDESLLTGESNLIPKRVGDPVYSGSFCASGSALYEAEKVGMQSLANQITAGARAFRRIYTPLQQQINLVIRLILLIAIYFQILLVITAVMRNLPIVVSVQMSVVIVGLIPNGLFLAIAAAYAMGAVRMVGQGALVQQSNAVESLSNVDVLCLDKTGTLTTNRIEFHALEPLGLAEAELQRLLGDYAASTVAGNRTTAALLEAFGGRSQPVQAETPFASERKWSALTLADGAEPGVYVLGAPEVLQPHLGASANGHVNEVIERWSAQGLRVLLFARGRYQGDGGLQDDNGQPQLPGDLRPLAAVSFREELRPHARETLDAFARAGIQLKIVSGDNPHTVAALARQVGMDPDLDLVSGLDLAGLDGTQLAQVAEKTTVFGRITPQQKRDLVRALQHNDHYVAMIGDGVNDVLALKRANLGIAMQGGSQAARGVADIILLNDAFTSLPHAFSEGQRIINGMQDIFKLFLTRVLYASLLILSTTVVGGFPFTPKHNALLTLLTVGIPAIALAAWARPGAGHREHLIRRLLHFVLPAALTLGMTALGVYLYFYVTTYQAVLATNPLSTLAAAGAALRVAQSALTTFTVFCGLLLIPLARPPSAAWAGGSEVSGDRRPLILALLLLIAYGLILIQPSLRLFFELARLSPVEYLIIVITAVAWAFLLRFTWRARLLERYLSVNLWDPNKHPAEED